MTEPTYEYTTLKQLIARTKVRGMITSSNVAAVDLFLKDVLLEGAKEMGTRQDFVEKTAVLEICDLSVELPCDFVTFDRGNNRNPPLVFTQNGRVDESVYSTMYSVVYTGGPFLTCSPYSSNPGLGIPTINIQDGRLWFSNNVTATECTISYLAINLDESGDLKIPANNSRPLINYGVAEYKKAMGESKASWGPYWDRWVDGKFDRRGQSQLLNTFEKSLLSRTMNSLF